MSLFDPRKARALVPTMEERATATGLPVEVAVNPRCWACKRAGNVHGDAAAIPGAPELHVWADMILCVDPKTCREHAQKIGTWKIHGRTS